ncbi:MAG: tetratricopeptide repeat protein [Burkholderiales bacterium]|nr:tetratricopeptide repeat protein [Burkholderiales bacterium]
MDAASLAAGLALHQAGRLAEAEAIYRQVLQAEPHNADALHLLGLLARQVGRGDVAIALIGQALAIAPAHAGYLNSLGLVHQDAGDAALAMDCYGRALVLGAEAVTYINLGNLLVKQGRLDDALAVYDNAVAAHPASAEAWTNRGNILDALRRWDQALPSYAQALALRPGLGVALRGRGNAFRGLGRRADAAASYREALAVEPANTVLLADLAVEWMAVNRVPEALACCDQLLALEPRNVAALSNRGNLLKALRRYEEAAQCFEAALQIAPGHPYALGSLLRSRIFSCDWTGYTQLAAALREQVRGGARADTPFSFLAVSGDAQEQLACARTYVRDKYPPVPALWTGGRRSHERIRVAYVSADFQNHPSMHLMAGLFEQHDRSRFELTALSLGPDSSHPMRQRVQRAFGRFADAQHLTDREAAQLLLELEADIVVDLNGFTQGSRLGILAHRPAPLQVSYLGYPGSCGADFFDYLIADAEVLPPQQRAHYSENIAWLPGCYQANDAARAIDDAPLSRADAGLPPEAFVFCCFNNNYKITPGVFGVWMRLLAQLPHAVLWLLEDNAAAMRNLRAQAQARGIDAQRLVFAPRAEPAQHLARHRLADLFLDTLPYNAHTTASDALWAGLPLLTCRGGAFAARVAASLLREAGLPELVTDSLAEYERKALELARSPQLLAALKLRVAQARETSTLFDTRQFARDIEAAYAQMWERHQQGLRPEDFLVTRQPAP